MTLSRPPEVPVRPAPLAPDHAGPFSATAGILLVAVTVATLLALAGAMGMFRTPSLGDQGLLTRVGYPLARAAYDLCGALTLGGSAFAAFALPAPSDVCRRVSRLVLTTAAGWAVAAAGCLILGASDVAGLPVTTPGFGSVLLQYLGVESGRLAAWTLGLVVLVTFVLAAGGRTALAWGAVLSAVALVPTALAGHAAGPGHEIVGSAWWLHALGIGVWVGGLVALATCARRAGPAVVARYSSLALGGFILVAYSGVAGAIPRLTSIDDLVTSGYGRLLLVKMSALVLLGAAGWWHRRHAIAALREGATRVFWRLIAVEAAVMGVAIGVAVVLGRSAPPVPAELNPNPSPAEIVTGEPLPPPLAPARLVTEVSWDVLWLAVAVILLTAYLAAVVRLRRRGDRWPVLRTLPWVLGCLVLVYITCGGLAVYARVYFSIHMYDHMALSMIAPPLLVLGAPMTLLLRATPARHDGSRGLREWALALVGSRYVRVISHPLTAAVLFAGSLLGFYYTDLFGLALRTHLGHELMMAHFVLVGYLFADSLIGIDPAPNRFPYPLRLLTLFITMAFHAFFAVGLMSSDVLLQARYFSSLGLGIDALADQRDGGAGTWGVGEVPTLLLAIGVAVAWATSDTRAGRRADRAAERDGDADLQRYNAMLSRLRESDDD